MNLKIEHLIKVLESWERSYLPPSATMAIKEASETIKALAQEVDMLTEASETIKALAQEVDMLTSLVEEQKEKIKELSKPVEPRFPVQSKKVKKNDT
jgi:DNA repair exonuclease SbcCD ATPase subunit